jgi:hypothetical protein
MHVQNVRVLCCIVQIRMPKSDDWIWQCIQSRNELLQWLDMHWRRHRRLTRPGKRHRKSMSFSSYVKLQIQDDTAQHSLMYDPRLTDWHLRTSIQVLLSDDRFEPLHDSILLLRMLCLARMSRQFDPSCYARYIRNVVVGGLEFSPQDPSDDCLHLDAWTFAVSCVLFQFHAPFDQTLYLVADWIVDRLQCLQEFRPVRITDTLRIVLRALHRAAGRPVDGVEGYIDKVNQKSVRIHG